MEGLVQIGFDVGWDHALHGVDLPESLREGALLDGFRAGAVHRGRAKPRETDRFVRKWLQLRRNAWKRSRIFQPDVTPDYLRFIDADHCPVTRARLTYSTGQGTDWSVDRLENDGGYARGNLVVMSTLANAAKDRLTYKDVCDILLCRDETGDVVFEPHQMEGLTPTEVTRLCALLMMNRELVRVVPARITPPYGIAVTTHYLSLSNLAIMSAYAVYRNDVKATLKRFDPSPLGIQRVVRRLMEWSRPRVMELVMGLDRDALARSAASGDQTVLLDFQREMRWVAEDAWCPASGAVDALGKWFRSASAASCASVLCAIALHPFGDNPRPVRIDDIEEHRVQFGRETGGYIET